MTSELPLFGKAFRQRRGLRASSTGALSRPRARWPAEHARPVDGRLTDRAPGLLAVRCCAPPRGASGSALEPGRRRQALRSRGDGLFPGTKGAGGCGNSGGAAKWRRRRAARAGRLQCQQLRRREAARVRRGARVRGWPPGPGWPRGLLASADELLEARGTTGPRPRRGDRHISRVSDASTRCGSARIRCHWPRAAAAGRTPLRRSRGAAAPRIAPARRAPPPRTGWSESRCALPRAHLSSSPPAPPPPAGRGGPGNLCGIMRSRKRSSESVAAAWVVASITDSTAPNNAAASLAARRSTASSMSATLGGAQQCQAARWYETWFPSAPASGGQLVEHRERHAAASHRRGLDHQR